MNLMARAWIVICFFTGITAIDNPHFWRATNFLPQFYEPRIAKSWLTSFDLFVGYGKTDQSRNQFGQTVPLLSLYGPERITTLGIGLPNVDFNNPVDVTLQNLALLGCPCDFGQLNYCGRFSLAEINFCFTQNLTCGFFAQLHFPFRNLEISNISACDASSRDCSENPNSGNTFWQTFMNLYPQFLTRYSLFITNPGSHNCDVQTTGIGDTSVLLGWTYNYEETEALDYVDFTLRAGVLIPTGKKKNPDLIFDIANGYNGHLGAPISADMALGYFEWLTIGAHTGAIIFVRREQCVRIHTDASQNGLIKLVKAEASEHEGTIWELCAYLKADHFCAGLSFLAGYNFAVQHRNQLALCGTDFITNETANADSTLLGWKMHTVNLLLEYDWTQDGNALGPRLGIFYNLQVGGQRTFKTNMAGGFLGFDFAICF